MNYELFDTLSGPPRAPVLFTEVPDAGHEGVWESYEGDVGIEVLNWLLTQSKP